MWSFGIVVLLIISLCFDLSIAGIKEKLQDLAGCEKLSPDLCDYNLMTFWYYNNDNLNGIQVDIASAATLPIYKDAPWKFLFHGLGCSKTDIPNPQLRTAYFLRGRYNIISADNLKPITGGLNYVCYPISAKNTAIIGKCTAAFLAQLINATIIPPTNKIHLIGHSLGAHIAGNTGHALQLLGFEKVYRITGLDPAGPLLENDDTEAIRILDTSDGAFVDSHRTNTRGVFSKGQKGEIGTMDILYNDGKQPGCEDVVGCSHRKAVEYYAESIFPIPPQNLKFYAWKKDEPNNKFYLIGEDVDTTLTGSFNVMTNQDPPYARGM